MSTAVTPRRSAGAAARCPAIVSALLVSLSVLLANATYLLTLRSNNPLLYHSGLGSPTKGITGLGPDNGHYPYTIDANDGWTVQSLGRLSAQMWSHGHVPLWNAYEGLGQPLAGEQQSASLFQPFIMLHLLPNGTFVMHLVLQLIAALTMLGFLRSLRLSWTAATVGGILFGLNGAFSVMTNAPYNPIAFFPMVLWGVEMVATSVQERRRPRLGITVIAVGLAWMLYAGFPETALIQGLVIGAWVLVRTIALRSHRVPFLVGNAVGGIGGILLSLPLLTTLSHFLGFAFTAYHGGGEKPPWTYDAHSFYGFFGGYLAGPFSSNPLMDGVAGYVTLASLLCAFIGLFGPRPRAVKIMLVTLVAMLMLNMFGAQWANTLLYAIPGVHLVLLYKYGIILLTFAFTLLTAHGVDDLARGRVKRSHVAAAAGLSTAYVIAALVYLDVAGRVRHPLWTIVAAVLFAAAIIAVTALFGIGAQRGEVGLDADDGADADDGVRRDRAGATRTIDTRAQNRHRFAAAAAACVLAAEALCAFAVPQLNASSPNRVDTAPVTFLQNHLGTSRFFTLGPIQPNYGSYWQIAELNVNDLPVPQRFSDYVMNDLRPQRGSKAYIQPVKGFNPFMPYLLVTRNSLPWGQRKILAAYGQQQKAYRDAGVRYLVAAPGIVDAASAQRYGLRHVFTSKKTEIFEDAKAAPYWDTNGVCAVTKQSRDAVTLDCPKATTLTRRELSTTGWSVDTNGRASTVASKPGQLFQRVSVPAGTSTLTFSFRPPHFRLAVIISLLALAALVAQLVLPAGGLRRRRTRDASRAPRSARPVREGGEPVAG